jgi:hypothetical protein
MQSKTRNVVMGDAATWPLAVVLCVVRRDPSDETWPECGFLVVGRGARVYLGNIGDLHAGPLLPQLEALECLHYLSFDAIVAAGWEID